MIVSANFYLHEKHIFIFVVKKSGRGKKKKKVIIKTYHGTKIGLNIKSVEML